MLNNEETKNIIFNDEQRASLEEYQARLSNLLSEIVNHTKILTGTKSECNRAVKERAYQEELLAELTPKVEEKKNQLNSYNEEINKATSILSKLTEEIRVKTSEQAKKDTEFSNREAKLVEIEVLQNKRAVELAYDTDILEQSKIDFNKKVATLKEVTSTF